MNVTSRRSITDKPSMCWPMPNFSPPLCHQVQLLMTGWVYTPCSVASAECSNVLKLRAAPLALSPPLASSTRWIHW